MFERNSVYVGSARHSAPAPDTTEHSLWTVDASLSGAGAIITTYEGTPHDVAVSGLLELVEITAPTPESLLDSVWSSLNPDLRVAAFAITPEIEESSALFRGSPARPTAALRNADDAEQE
jgi:hypothetical protein